MACCCFRQGLDDFTKPGLILQQGQEAIHPAKPDSNRRRHRAVVFDPKHRVSFDTRDVTNPPFLVHQHANKGLSSLSKPKESETRPIPPIGPTEKSGRPIREGNNHSLLLLAKSRDLQDVVVIGSRYRRAPFREAASRFRWGSMSYTSGAQTLHPHSSRRTKKARSTFPLSLPRPRTSRKAPGTVVEVDVAGQRRAELTPLPFGGALDGSSWWP
jgi:hypothetical protein